MTSAPLIGLPGRRKTGAEIDGFPGALSGLDIDIYLADYSRGVLQAGGLPVNLPLDADPKRFIEHLDGIILTGGADVDPSRYGHDNTSSDVDPQRDAIEFSLLEGALEAEIPVLGICRGLQVLNVHAGGTLHQHVPEHARYDVDPAARIHRASVEPGSVLHALYGEEVAINSLHHQTIDRLGRGLTVIARDGDDTVEAVQMDGRDVIGVQWHPEMLAATEPIFAWLVERAAEVRARRS